MTRSKMDIRLIACAILVAISLAPAYCKPRNGLTLAMLRKSEEVGRLRRGFQTSSLATARGFGKRDTLRAVIPFVSSKPEEAMQQFEENAQRKNNLYEQDLERFQNMNERYPVDLMVEMMRLDKTLAKAFVERYMDSDGDGLISLEELLRMK